MDSYRSCKFVSVALLGLAFLVTGCRKTPHITLACAATPPAIYQGEPVTVIATAGSVSSGKHASVLYNWSGTGVTSDGATAHVTTDALAPGTYTVNAEVKEGKPGKEGRNPKQAASCAADFKVKEFEPPAAVCAANPSTLLPGGRSDIICTGVSPQDRPLTYAYSASAGTISGAGTSAVFSAAGAPTGPVTVACTVQDDKNHSTTTEISLNIQAPPPPPIPHVQAVCNLSFERDKKRPTRVDNEAKACLDEISLYLQAIPEAKLVLVADANAREKQMTAKQKERAARHTHAKVEYFAEQRAVNAKQYLVKEKGVDPARIALATGLGDDQNVHDYLVPQGAIFEDGVQGTSWINETEFNPEERKPLFPWHRSGTPAE